MKSTCDPDVTNNSHEQQYEIRRGAELIGVASYETVGEVVTFTHTRVSGEYEGKGYASRLAKAALSDARNAGQRVVPLCSFFGLYIHRHPEFQGLVKRPV